MLKGQHNLTKQELIYLKFNNQNHNLDLRDKPFGNKDKITPYGREFSEGDINNRSSNKSSSNQRQEKNLSYINN